MSENINLIPLEAVPIKEKKNYHKTVNVSAIGALLIVAVILLALFGYQLFLSSTSSRIDTQTEQAEKETLEQSGKEITRRALVNKLDESNKFLSSRLKYSTGYKVIQDTVGGAATLTEGVINNDGSVTLSGEVKSLKNLKKVVDRLNKVESSNDLGKIFLVSLTKEIKEPYKFTIDYDYLKKGLLPEKDTQNQSNE